VTIELQTEGIDLSLILSLSQLEICFVKAAKDSLEKQVFSLFFETKLQKAVGLKINIWGVLSKKDSRNTFHVLLLGADVFYFAIHVIKARHFLWSQEHNLGHVDVLLEKVLEFREVGKFLCDRVVELHPEFEGVLGQALVLGHGGVFHQLKQLVASPWLLDE